MTGAAAAAEMCLFSLRPRCAFMSSPGAVSSELKRRRVQAKADEMLPEKEEARPGDGERERGGEEEAEEVGTCLDVAMQDRSQGIYSVFV